jgi:hypothetical protein
VFTSIIPANWETEVRLWFQTNPVKSTGLYLKNKLKTKGLGCGSSGIVLALVSMKKELINLVHLN